MTLVRWFDHWNSVFVIGFVLVMTGTLHFIFSITICIENYRKRETKNIYRNTTFSCQYRLLHSLSLTRSTIHSNGRILANFVHSAGFEWSLFDLTETLEHEIGKWENWGLQPFCFFFFSSRCHNRKLKTWVDENNWKAREPENGRNQNWISFFIDSFCNKKNRWNNTSSV